jgi:hypothetical protein
MKTHLKSQIIFITSLNGLNEFWGQMDTSLREMSFIFNREKKLVGCPSDYSLFYTYTDFDIKKITFEDKPKHTLVILDAILP